MGKVRVSVGFLRGAPETPLLRCLWGIAAPSWRFPPRFVLVWGVSYLSPRPAGDTRAPSHATFSEPLLGGKTKRFPTLILLHPTPLLAHNSGLGEPHFLFIYIYFCPGAGCLRLIWCRSREAGGVGVPGIFQVSALSLGPDAAAD